MLPNRATHHKCKNLITLHLRLVLGTALKIHSSATNWLKLKVRKFCELTLTIKEITGEKLEGGGLFATPILNRVSRVYLIYK